MSLSVDTTPPTQDSGQKSETAKIKISESERLESGKKRSESDEIRCETVRDKIQTWKDKICNWKK